MSDEYYNELGVKRTADETEIKKAYRKLAMKYHPDREGGDDEKFKKIGAAYDVLSDKDKRRIYDMHGKQGLEGGGGMPGGHSHEDIFAQMFGGGRPGGSGGFGMPGGGMFEHSMGGGGGMPSMFTQSMGGSMGGSGMFEQSIPMREKEPENIIKKINIVLRDICKGKRVSFKITRIVLDKSMIVACQGCRGAGVKKTTRQVGGGMFMQQQAVCSDCEGKGQMVPPTASTPKPEIINLEIYPGCPENIVFVFPGMTDERIGTPPGNLIFKIKYVDDATYRVIDNTHDLELKEPMKINLHESLVGFTKTLIHPDGTEIHVCSRLPVKPGRYCLAGRGIAIKHKSYNKIGDMYVVLEVDYPTKLKGTDGNLATILGQSAVKLTPAQCADGYGIQLTHPRPANDISQFVLHQTTEATKSIHPGGGGGSGGGCPVS